MSYSPKSMRKRSRAGFSLVEMIGVLAIIAILAVVIVPKVFSTIASSRVTTAVGSITSVKTAVADFVGKYGSVPTSGVANNRLDDLLVTTGFLESRFAVKIGAQPASVVAGGVWTRNATTGLWGATGGANQNTQSRIVSQTSTAAAPGASTGRNFRLDGTNDLPTGSIVITAILYNVTAKEAQELSQRIDGDTGTETLTTTADDRGKVVYAASAAANKTVYVYLAHQ